MNLFNGCFAGQYLLCLRVENRTHEIPFFGLHHVHRCVSTRGSCPSSLPRYIPHTCSHLESVRVQSATQCTECRYILHTCSHLESIRVQSATEWTASVHTLHMPKPNVTRVQSATEWTASVHILHMPKPNVARVQSATEWTASVHTLHMPKPNVTRVQSATEWTDSVHTLHMPKPNVTRVQSAIRNGLLRYILYTCPNLMKPVFKVLYGMDCFGTYFTHAQT